MASATAMPLCDVARPRPNQMGPGTLLAQSNALKKAPVEESTSSSPSSRRAASILPPDSGGPARGEPEALHCSKLVKRRGQASHGQWRLRSGETAVSIKPISHAEFVSEDLWPAARALSKTSARLRRADEQLFRTNVKPMPAEGFGLSNSGVEYADIAAIVSNTSRRFRKSCLTSGVGKPATADRARFPSEAITVCHPPTAAERILAGWSFRKRESFLRTFDIRPYMITV